MHILNNKAIEIIVSEIAIPFSDILANDDRLRHFLDTEEKNLKHSIDIAKLSIAVIYDDEYVMYKLKKGAAEHNSLGIETVLMKEYLSLFFKLVTAYMKKYNLYNENFKNKLCEYEDFFIKSYQPEATEDTFFDFDSEKIDENINLMHYKEHKKISAKEFMEEIGDEDLFHDMQEAFELFENIVDETLNKEYIESLVKIFSEFVKAFNLSYEFKDIGYSIETLVMRLQTIEVNKFSETQKEFCKALLETIESDLKQWYKLVAIEQTAVDIHYLDASLLANVGQIDIVLEQIQDSQEKNSDDDFEMF